VNDFYSAISSLNQRLCDQAPMALPRVGFKAQQARSLGSRKAFNELKRIDLRANHREKDTRELLERPSSFQRITVLLRIPELPHVNVLNAFSGQPFG
jgi:hypothetical protein